MLKSVRRRVRIRQSESEGSAKVLDGLRATVIGPHPVVHGWVKIKLDPNDRVSEREWSIAEENLEDVRETSHAYIKRQFRTCSTA